MLRAVVLAAGLSALIWTAPVRPAESLAPETVLLVAGAEACQVGGTSGIPSDTDRYWRAAHQTLAPVGASLWKFAPVHADLAHTLCARMFDLARDVTSPDPPVRSSPRFLRHSPLLI